MDDLLRGSGPYVCTARDGYTHNALLACAPGDRLMFHTARVAFHRWKENPDSSPEWISGPLLMTEQAKRFGPKRLDPALVTPLDWREHRYPANPLDMSEEFPNAYAATFWKHNW